MADYDVFNGDADGLCALLQLRHAQPRDAKLVTGVKRDIALVEKVDAGAGDRVTVLDVSLDKNRAPLIEALERGAEVFYCDHHFAGDIPDHPGLETLINTAPDVCTSILINGRLRNAHVEWAIVGAFGDNMGGSARRLAARTSLSDEDLSVHEALGVYLNYNGYGATEDDLHFRPAELYGLLRPYPTPAAFIADDRATFDRLATGYREDMTNARGADVIHERPHAAALMLPDAAWARRVSGVYGNALANEHPDRAHAVLTHRADGGYVVSVRAPLHDRVGADDICRQFPTGGGRKAAAGVNVLPEDMLDGFVETFSHYYAERARQRGG